jgi:DNA-binding CsgD family transcriptional regulator
MNSHADRRNRTQAGPGSPAEGLDPDTAPARVESPLALLFRVNLGALYLVDDERHVVVLNEAAARLLGAGAPARVAGRRIDDFVLPGVRAELEHGWRALTRKGELNGRTEILRRDGRLVEIQYRAIWCFQPGRHLVAAREVTTTDQAPDAAAGGPRRPALSAREREVLQLAAHGGSARRIADALVLSEGTVKTHLQNIYSKLGACDRAAAVAEGMRRGLIQ